MRQDSINAKDVENVFSSSSFNTKLTVSLVFVHVFENKFHYDNGLYRLSIFVFFLFLIYSDSSSYSYELFSSFFV
jgi:hypothetical protein